ncbi:amidohydrolase family protein [Solwaraspora sp. WMMD791]|uniref:amidohydrolase family protein n=1 Tax=Solwaraspora sp. WMMD791 TaxID=3016086 RepID=UPI002499CE20|nr:amidohydrolase family protein [Solwaraspora sp. WMMD791]WFE29236.1 amidohydrolase family protein [Solwaraspora sp. WMMD791]
MNAGRVDVHHHAILPAIAQLMREHGATFTLPWSLPQTWQVLADNRIDVALVSNPIPAGLFDSVEVAARFNRAANEAVAELVAAHPGRFGLLAALPMPYVDAALDEVAYAFDTLRADGVVLIAHAGDSYLGAPIYDPLLAELNRRRAVVLVHPMTLPGGPVDGVPPVLADFLLDTTRAAISLIWTGALDRYPDISFVLAHGGGFLPYAASRVAALGEAFYDVPAAQVRSALGRFHYDLALTAPSGLPSLLAAVGPDRILYGTDWSAAPEPVVAAGGRAIDRQLAALDPAARAAIERDNALRLFPRLRLTR